MKTMKKVLAVLLLACMAMGVLSACTGNPESTNTTNTNAPTTTGSAEPKVVYNFIVVDEENNPIEGVRVQLCKGDEACYNPVTSDAEGKVTYDMCPEYGEYDVHIIVKSIPAGYEFDNTEVKTTEDVHEYILVLKKKCSHEFINDVCTKCQAKKSFLSSNPRELHIGYTNCITLTENRIDENPDDSQDTSKYYVCVTPSKQEDVGRYRISIEAPEGVELYLGRFNSSFSATSLDETSGENPSLEFNMEKRYMVNAEGQWTFHSSWLFGFSVVGDVEYPVTVRIRVERIEDLIPGVNCIKYDMCYPEAEKTENAEEVLGDLTGKELVVLAEQKGNYRCSNCHQDPEFPDVPGSRCEHCGDVITEDDLILSQITPVLGADGYYHVDSEDGSILLVNLTKTNVYLTTSFAEVNSVSVREELSVQTKVSDLHIRYDYYENMIQSYAKLCTADGYYMVNEQLYNFLLSWVKQHVSSLNKDGMDDIHSILPLCGYYSEN